MIRILISFLLLGLVSLAIADEAEREITLKLPPASLGRWYKPANERQVWLHTMFGLRRAYQAVREYLLLEKPKLAGKWARRLDEGYRSIGKMVPEWREELDIQQLDALHAALRAGDAKAAGKALRKLGSSCRSCHREYRAIAAVLYRAPDFSRITVEDSESLEEEAFDKVMERLSTLLNRVKIAAGDGRKRVAGESLAALGRRLEDLGESCGQCHQDAAPRGRILGTGYRQAADRLGAAIAAGDVKAGGRALGELAVRVCARCHGVHRLASDLRETLIEEAE